MALDLPAIWEPVEQSLCRRLLSQCEQHQQRLPQVGERVDAQVLARLDRAKPQESGTFCFRELPFTRFNGKRPANHIVCNLSKEQTASACQSLGWMSRPTLFL